MFRFGEFQVSCINNRVVSRAVLRAGADLREASGVDSARSFFVKAKGPSQRRHQGGISFFFSFFPLPGKFFFSHLYVHDIFCPSVNELQEFGRYVMVLSLVSF